MRPERIHPDDDWEATGDDPGGGDFLRGPMLERFKGVLELGKRMLPGDHGLVTRIGEDKTEIPAEDIEVEHDEETGGYKARIMHGVGEHRKEIAVTAITVAGLIVVINRIHARKK